MQFKSIIAAIDLEDDLAEGVVRAAESLSQKDGAKLEVVSVWPALTASSPGQPVCKRRALARMRCGNIFRRCVKRLTGRVRMRRRNR